MANEKRYWLMGGGSRNDVRQPTSVPNSTKQTPRFAVAAPQAQLQFSTSVSKSSLRNVGRHANELLNFTYAKRERVTEQGAALAHTRTKRASVKPVVSNYSKEQYLLANCQFAVRHGTCLKDEVDTPIDWQEVEFVRISACKDEMPHCPICLDAPPTGARITKCGHIYCYVCMLRYFAVASEGNDPVASCPICAESMREREMRIAQLRLVRSYRVGDRLCFALVRRSGGSVFQVEPFADRREPGGGSKEAANDWQFFSKVIRVSTKQVETVVADEYELIECERQAIAGSLKQHSEAMLCSAQTLSAAEFEDLEHQLVFVELALGHLSQRLTKLRSEIRGEIDMVPDNFMNTIETVSSKREIFQSIVSSIEFSHSKSEEMRKRYVDAFDDVADQNLEHNSCLVVESPATAELFTSPTAVPGQSGVCAKSTVSCVYQSADGQPIFLHSLNVRCLLAQFGDAPAPNEPLGEQGLVLNEHFPSFIEGTIVQIDSFEMTSDVRKRYKHLSHLPLLSHFAIAELDLGSEPGLLDERILRMFSAQTEKRRMMRERRALEDRLRTQEAEQLALEREHEHRAMLDSSNFPSLLMDVEELTEVNESELHNEFMFPQIGICKQSESAPMVSGFSSRLSPVSTSAAPLVPSANLNRDAPAINSVSCGVWFRNTELNRSSDVAAPTERQTFSSLVRSIREDESKRQASANASCKTSKQERIQAAVWSKLKNSNAGFNCGAHGRSGLGYRDSDDADYDRDGASSLSHYKDAFQHDVDTALLRAFSTMTTSTSAYADASEKLDVTANVDVAPQSDHVIAMRKSEDPLCDGDIEKQNAKRKKKVEKKAKGTLLFSTNMRRPL